MFLFKASVLYLNHTVGSGKILLSNVSYEGLLGYIKHKSNRKAVTLATTPAIRGTKHWHRNLQL